MVEDVIVVSVTSGVMLADRINRVILAGTSKKKELFQTDEPQGVTLSWVVLIRLTPQNKDERFWLHRGYWGGVGVCPNETGRTG